MDITFYKLREENIANSEFTSRFILWHNNLLAGTIIVTSLWCFNKEHRHVCFNMLMSHELNQIISCQLKFI